MADTVMKELPLTNGTGSMPVVGLGTFTVFGETGDVESVRQAVRCALEAGYRHIDCAWNYGNEEAVGDAIKECVDAGKLKREDIFITTKLWNTHHHPNDVMPALKDSLAKLKTSYVDMYLIHWPISLQFNGFDTSNIVPKSDEGQILFAEHKLEATWAAMEVCQKTGLAKNIGISNFNSKQTERIFQACTVKPANMQIEITPYMSNRKLVDLCKEKGMVVTAYAPLGNMGRTWRNEGDPDPFEEPLLKEIAESKGKTIAQVILRFHLQNGICVIPKSVTPSRIQENINVFDFNLTEEEMTKVASLDRNLRVFKEPIGVGHPEYPFDEPF